MLRLSIATLIIVFLLNACGIGNTQEEVWEFSRKFEFVILNNDLEPVIGFDSNQYHPDSVILYELTSTDSLFEVPGNFSSCGKSPSIQWFNSKPYLSIDTNTYYVKFAENEFDTVEIFHYYYEADDFYYKIYLYNGVPFDERTNPTEYETDGCGSLPTYLIKETK